MSGRRRSLATSDIKISQSFLASGIGVGFQVPLADLPTARRDPNAAFDSLPSPSPPSHPSSPPTNGSQSSPNPNYPPNHAPHNAPSPSHPPPLLSTKPLYATDIELTAEEFQVPGVLCFPDSLGDSSNPTMISPQTQGGEIGLPSPPPVSRSLFGPRGLGGLRREMAIESGLEQGNNPNGSGWNGSLLHGNGKSGPSGVPGGATGKNETTGEVNFADVVDIDAGEAWDAYVSDDLVGKLVESVAFRLGILLIIVANSVLIGVQTDRSTQERFDGFLSALDSVFLMVFVVEIGLKWYHGFMRFWLQGWNIFDVIIVAASLLGPSLSFVSSGRVLRILRVIRAFRSLRSISALQGLQVIVQTILQSLPDMLNILLLLLIMAFIFAVVGVTVFGEAVPEHFGSLDEAMFSLFVVTTQDGWAIMFRKLEAEGLFIPAAIYFVTFIVIGAFVLANVFVGVVVTNLQVSYAEIKKFKRAQRRSLVNATTAAVYRGVGGAAAAGAALAAAKASSSSGQTHAPGTRPLLPLLPTPDVPLALWRSQDPLELPQSLYSLPLSTLENYLVLLTALEGNLNEFVEIRTRLHAVLATVREVNQLHQPDELDEEYDSGGEGGNSGGGGGGGGGGDHGGVAGGVDDDPGFGAGMSIGRDVLSRQIRAKQHQELRKRR